MYMYIVYCTCTCTCVLTCTLHNTNTCTYFRCLGSHFSGFRELSLTKEQIELADKEFFSSSKVVTGSHAKGKVWITQSVGDIGDKVGFIDTH